jgi:hypothetical protein
VIESGDVLLPPEWRALVAGELRTTYTFWCETHKKPAVWVQARQPEKSGLRALGNFDMLSVNLQTGAKRATADLIRRDLFIRDQLRDPLSYNLILGVSAPDRERLARRNGSLMSSTSAKARRTRKRSATQELRHRDSSSVASGNCGVAAYGPSAIRVRVLAR